MCSLNWYLSVITMTKKDCACIMPPVIKYIFTKLKSASTIKRKVIYGLVHLQGMRFKTLYTLL